MNVARLVRGITAAAVIIASAGCSAGESDAGPGPAQLPEKNRMLWVMPLDAYRVDPQLAYAVDVLVEPCMQENGFTFQRPAVDVTKRSETVTASGRELFNVDVAATWGYGGAPDPNGDVLRAAEAQAMTWPQEEQDQYDECLRRAREELPPETVNNAVAGLSLPTWDDAAEDPDVVEAAGRWVQCMQPLGFTDLPDSPDDASGGMPTQSMADAFGELADGHVNVQTPAQEAEEIRLATFDAECRESSGYAQARYDAEWEAQVRVVQENEETLEGLLDQKAAYEKKVDAIFREAGLA